MVLVSICQIGASHCAIRAGWLNETRITLGLFSLWFPVMAISDIDCIDFSVTCSGRGLSS